MRLIGGYNVENAEASRVATLSLSPSSSLSVFYISPLRKRSIVLLSEWEVRRSGLMKGDVRAAEEHLTDYSVLFLFTAAVSIKHIKVLH